MMSYLDFRAILRHTANCVKDGSLPFESANDVAIEKFLAFDAFNDPHRGEAEIGTQVLASVYMVVLENGIPDRILEEVDDPVARNMNICTVL